MTYAERPDWWYEFDDDPTCQACEESECNLHNASTTFSHLIEMLYGKEPFEPVNAYDAIEELERYFKLSHNRGTFNFTVKDQIQK